ncbi:hypothetical protein ACFV0T_26410 [Streptomyces sp. NPDC059582]|uniref:hypothetical protein n=1 Tax=Streptomyces sp. NPDC059582 TaxID=3346875 RepID=UPI0036AE03E6
MSNQIRAPWTPEQVAALEQFQIGGRMHPFTCGAARHALAPRLVPSREGWHCPDPDCDYTQDWAHEFMADPSAWPRSLKEWAAAGSRATEATELDKTRRYLRPVRATVISDDPDGVHLTVYQWLPMFDEWATGPGICGESMMQGALPEGTEVTCPRCQEWRPRYERMLAPGYRPEADDPEALRTRAQAAENALRAILNAPDAPKHCHDQRGVWDGGGPCAYCTALSAARKVLGRQTGAAS